MDKKKRLNSLQVIRALSAIMIVGHHVSLYMNDASLPILNKIFFNGWVGVDVFLVLSGFILYYTSYKKIGQKDQCKEFLLKRLSRIYPVYWIVLSAVLIVWPSYFGTRFMMKDIIKSYLLVPQTKLLILGVTWFLSYIVFFYLIFAILIYFNKKISYSLITVWFIGVLLNSIGVIHSTSFYINFIFSNHFIEIIVGCLIAVSFIRKPIKKPILSLLIGSIIFILTFYQIINGSILRSSTESKFLFSLAVGLIILGCASHEVTHNLDFPKSVLAIGDASYAIFLTHFNILTFTNLLNKRLGFHSIVEFLYHTIILIVLGIVFYYTVEKSVINYINILRTHPKYEVVSDKLKA